MIVIGGTNPIHMKTDKVIREKGDEPKDPWAQGIAVFDMTDMKFTNSYQTTADPYKLPRDIQQYYNTR